MAALTLLLGAVPALVRAFQALVSSRLADEQFAVFADLSTSRSYVGDDQIPEVVGLITHGAVWRGTAFCGEGELVGLEECFTSGEQEWPKAQAHHYVKMLQVPYEVFRRFATETAPLAVMQEQATRTKKALLDQARATKPVQDRVGMFLMDLALRFGHKLEFGVERGVVVLSLDLTQDQIAQASDNRRTHL